MSFNLGRAVGYLMLDTSGFTSGFSTARRSMQQFMDQSNTLAGRTKSLGTAFTTAGSTLTKNLTLPIVTAGTAAAKAAIDFESAFAGVRKTVDATEQEYEQLSDSIVKLSNKMPQSASAIAGVMEVAGQLGIRGTENLVQFTETMIMLGDATNLSSEEAATSLARVMNIMGTAGEDISRLGATVVALGNNFATTESEIVEMTNRLAAGAKLAGLTEAETMALAAAMSSVGIQAEAGGTAMVQTFNEIESAVANGGEKLDEFARIAGMSSEEFTSTWEDKPIVALQGFIKGLGQLEENGESTVLVLDKLGLTGIRQSNMLKSLGLASELLGDSINLANSAWQENTALVKEAETRYGTLASKLAILWNNIKNLAISFGNLLMPAIEKVSSKIRSITERIDAMSEGQKKALVTILAVVAGLGPLLLILGKLIVSISLVMTAVKALFVLFAANPIALVITLIAGLVAAVVHLWNNSEAFREFWIQLWEEVKAAAQNAAENIGAFLQNVALFFDNLGQSISNSISNFVGFWILAWEDAKQCVENAKENFRAAADNIAAFFSALGEHISTIWNSILTWVSESLTNMVSTIEGFGETLFAAGSSIFSSLFSGFQSIWSSIVSWVEEKVGWIASKLSGALSSVSSAGGASGSYATGLDYVLSDRTVRVHEGEAILSKEENQNRGKGFRGETVIPLVFNITEQIDGMTLARNQYKYNLQVSENHGVSLIKT